MQIVDAKIEGRYKRIRNILLLGGLLYVLPVILANRYYNDDLARSLYGATGWNGDGRPLAESIMLFVSGGEPLTDISPLPLLMAVVVLAMVLTVYAKKNLSFCENAICVAMALLFILVQPFTMAGISYKYDCLFMFLAVSIPFLLFSLNESIPLWIYVGLSALSGVMVMSMYQAAFGMFLILELIQFYLWMQTQRGTFRQYLKTEIPRFAGIMVGALLYVVVIAPRFVDAAGWRNEAARMSLGPNMGTITNILRNIKRGLTYQYSVLQGTSKYYSGSIILLCLLTVIAIGIRWWKGKHDVKGSLLAVVFIILPFAAVVSVYLPMTVLSSFDTKYRVFLCFGGALLLLAVTAMVAFQNKCKILMVIMGLCLFFQYSCVYSYGNALKCQKEYEEYTVQQVAHDLETVNAEKEYHAVSFLGNAPRARQLQKICEKYPFFNEIVPVYVSNDTWIGGAWVYHYLQYDLEICASDDTDLAVVQEQTPVLKNALYDCYVNGEKIVVRWK